MQVGTVIRSYVEDTNPPKIKFWIIVGVSPDGAELATVYINTWPNDFISRNQEMAQAQYPVISDSRGLVDYNCFANCFEIIRKDAVAVQRLLTRRPDYIRGKLWPEEIDDIMKLLEASPNISMRDKKRFSLKY